MIKKRSSVQFIELLVGMTEKELRARYKYTVLGFFWMAVNPILQMIVVGFVFRFFMKEPIENYYYYLLIGLLVWNFFSLSLAKTTQSIVWEKNLIKKAKFSRSVIPLSIILSNFVHLIITMAILVIPISFLGTLTFIGIFYIFVALILLFLFAVGVSLFTSALNVRFRDINFIVQAVLIVWFYLNPIVYVLSMVPYSYYWLWRFNPMTSILQLMQHGFLGQPLPGTAMLSINITLILLVFILGIYTFKRESKDFDDWV
jgi:lipopolysaccharide transport system permease protein